MNHETVIIKEVRTSYGTIRKYARVIKRSGMFIIGDTLSLDKLSNQQREKAIQSK